MTHLRTIREELEELEESFNRFEHYHRYLIDYRENLYGSWDDEAAREVNTKFLDPFEEESQDIKEDLKSQLQSLGILDDIVYDLDEWISRIQELSAQIDIGSEQCKHKMDEANKFLLESLEKKTEALDYLNASNQLSTEIESLLELHKQKLKSYSNLK